jgi:hypothetical protein
MGDLLLEMNSLAQQQLPAQLTDDKQSPYIKRYYNIIDRGQFMNLHKIPIENKPGNGDGSKKPKRKITLIARNIASYSSSLSSTTTMFCSPITRPNSI